MSENLALWYCFVIYRLYAYCSLVVNNKKIDCQKGKFEKKSGGVDFIFFLDRGMKTLYN